MEALRPISAGLLIFAVLGFCLWLFRRLRQYRPIRPLQSGVLVTLGALSAMALIPLEDWVLSAAKIDLVIAQGSAPSAQLAPALAMLLFCVPLEEAVKVGVLWPLYLRRRLQSGAQGVSAAVFVASGFAVGEICMATWLQIDSWIGLLRIALSLPAHIFFAGVWGYVLGGRGRDRYFSLTFIGCVVLHAIYDHIVFSRGPALLVVALPMFATMAWGVFALLRDGASNPITSSSVYSLLEPRGLGSTRRSTEGHPRGLKLHWILFGALVNLGVTLSFLATTVYAGHRFGVDFALIEDASTEGVLPVLFLAGGLLASFPVSAFLVARASGTRSVLEPAWAMGASIIFVLAVFSVTEPTAIVIAAGLAPVGFLLACAGAIFGFRRG